MPATLHSTSSIAIGDPLAIGMTGSRNSFGLDRCVTYGADLMLATVHSTSGIAISYPLAIGVTGSRNSFGLNSLVTYRANLMLASVCSAACFIVYCPSSRGVRYYRCYLLYNDSFFTNRTMRSLGQSCFGTSCINRGENGKRILQGK